MKIEEIRILQYKGKVPRVVGSTDFLRQGNIFIVLSQVRETGGAHYYWLILPNGFIGWVGPIYDNLIEEVF